MMQAVLYARVSSQDQEERGTVAMQLDYAERWAPEHGIRMVGRYVDEDVSGMLRFCDRPEGARLLQEAPELRRRGVQRVLIYDWSRFARDPYPLWDGIHYLERVHGFRIKSMTQEADTSTPERVLLLCLQSGVASYERAKFLERSANATEMLARQGVWLGGIVPYGYRKIGDRREARLVISEDPIPGLTLSEADVIRELYRRLAHDHVTTFTLADWLNALGVPPSYVRDGREILRGKRKQTTQGRWLPGRVRNMVVNTVYKGVHRWGKRGDREVIERPVPAIVTEAEWDAAQRTLRENQLWAPRNGHRVYLLRGLIKCRRCGLTFMGCHSTSGGKSYRYYWCGGVSSWRRNKPGESCRSRVIPATVEEWVWEDIEGFLRNPGPALDELAARQAPGLRPEVLLAEVEGLERALQGKTAERDRILSLYRRGLIDDAACDRQLVQIDAEERELRTERERLARLAAERGALRGRQEAAAALLAELGELLDVDSTPETQRRLIEALVARVEVDTLEVNGQRQADVTAYYRFAGPASGKPSSELWVANCTDALVGTWATR